jgi:hypothetical protein
MARPNDKRKVFGIQILSTKVQARAHRSIPEMLRTPRRRQVLVVRRNSGPDEGVSLPPLQLVENLTERTLESCGEGNRLESRQMQTHAGL